MGNEGKKFQISLKGYSHINEREERDIILFLQAGLQTGGFQINNRGYFHSLQGLGVERRDIYKYEIAVISKPGKRGKSVKVKIGDIFALFFQKSLAFLIAKSFGPKRHLCYFGYWYQGEAE